MLEIFNNRKKIGLFLKGKVKENYSLASLTWFKVGGKAKLFYEPHDEADLITLIRGIKISSPLYVIGAGSNLLIRDGGINGIVLKLGKKFSKLQVEDKKFVRVGAGFNCIKLARKLASIGLGGLEFYSGIPGTIGGAIKMNSGAYNEQTSDRLVKVIALDRLGNKNILCTKDYHMSYRKSSFSDDLIFLEGVFKCDLVNSDVSLKKIEKLNKKRILTQPIKKKTSGSTFKNTKKEKAWELINKCGANKLVVGNARVSSLHSNFLINTGNSSSKDIEELGEKIRHKVWKDLGVDLEWEIKIIGKKTNYKRFLK